ncbi:MAG: hypothetical protein M1821_000983 [Bathelium mastoideum]|nr:MAG: hypothetical protein M1821_000983 [Bathelium mastoideum]
MPCQRCSKAGVRCTIGAIHRQPRPRKVVNVQETRSDALQNRKSPSNDPSTQQPSPLSATHQYRADPIDARSHSDDQHLFPLQWADMDLDLDQVQELPSGVNSAVPVTDSTALETRPNSNIDTLSFPLLATPDSFDMVWADPAENFRPASKQGPAPFEDLSVPVHLQNTPPVSRTQQSKPRPITVPAPPPTLPDACIQELSNLSARLIKDLNRVISCKLASSFLFTPAGRDSARCAFSTTDGSVAEDNAIGRMLHGSETFLDILRSAQSQPSPVASSAVSELSQDDDMYSRSDFAELSEGRYDGNKEALVEARARLSQSNLRRQEISRSAPLKELLRYDVPSTLAILTCYTCLLKIYETVFFVIQHTLECAPSLASVVKLPPTVSGLQINGFLLDNHRNLQIRILIQVSSYMLDSIETATSELLAIPTFQAVLTTLLKQEGLDYSENNKTGMKTSRDLLRKVEALLK